MIKTMKNCFECKMVSTIHITHILDITLTIVQAINYTFVSLYLFFSMGLLVHRKIDLRNFRWKICQQTIYFDYNNHFVWSFFIQFETPIASISINFSVSTSLRFSITLFCFSFERRMYLFVDY